MTQPMSEKAAVRLRQFNAEQSDWYGKCRHCGEVVEGTLATLAQHREVCRGKQGSE